MIDVNVRAYRRAAVWSDVTTLDRMPRSSPCSTTMIVHLLGFLTLVSWCTSATGKPTLFRTTPTLFGRSLATQLVYPGYQVLYTQLNTTEQELLAFIDSLDGDVTLRGQPQYDHVRNYTEAVNEYFNAVKPLMVVSCASEGDVQEAIDFASERGLPLCARAGGHDSGGYSTCANGVVIDVSPMSQVLEDHRVQQNEYTWRLTGHRIATTRRGGRPSRRSMAGHVCRPVPARFGGGDGQLPDRGRRGL